MAIKQEPFQRQMLTPTVDVKAGTAFESLGTAASALATTVAGVASDIAIEQAKQKGEADVVAGKQPETLAPGLTAATKAYNKAVSTTEANRMIESGREQIEQAYIEHSNPATFTTQSPALFKVAVEGIVQGTTEFARPGNEEKIRSSLSAMGTRGSMAMLSQAIKFDNANKLADFSQDMTYWKTQANNAAIAGNHKAEATAYQKLDETLDNGSIESQQINSIAPKIKAQLEHEKQVNALLGSYSEAVANKTESQWLSDFSKSKGTISYDVYQSAAKGIINIRDTAKSLDIANNAEANATLHRDINNGTISTHQQLSERVVNQDVTPLQTIRLQEFLDNKNAAQYKGQAETINFKENIIKSRPTFNSSSIANKKFNESVHAYEQDTGKIANLLTMKESITGENEFPVSGMLGAKGSQTPGVPLGRNVPQYDAAIKEALINPGNPNLSAQAASIANDMLFVREGQADMLKIDGKALAVVTNYASLIKAGMGSEEAVTLAMNTVLSTSEGERDLRLKEYDSTYKKPKWGFKPKIDSMFEDAFDAKSNLSGNDPARSVFDNVFRDQYAHTGSQEQALKATKYIMRSWGTSRFFADGVVSNNVPEKESNTASEGYAFDNQIRVRFQGKINSRNIEISEAEAVNKERKSKGLKPLPLPVKFEWGKTSETINLNNLSDTDKVLRPLGVVLSRETLGVYKENVRQFGAGGVPDRIGKAHPSIIANGVESELYLITGPDTRLNQDGGLRYTLAYRDKFGIQNTIIDTENYQGVLQIAPQELDKWAPDMLDERNSAAFKEMAIKIKTQQLKQELSLLGEEVSMFQPSEEGILNLPFLPGLLSKHSPEFLALKKQIFEVRNTPAKDLEALLRTRVNPQQATKEDTKKINDADVISVEPTKDKNNAS